MSRLTVTVWDEQNKSRSFTDDKATNPEKFVNLNDFNWADHATRIDVNTSFSPDQVAGDHILMFDEAKLGDTDTVAVDPAISKIVSLNQLIHNNRGFDKRAAAIRFILNPHADGSFHLRASLYDHTGQAVPSLTFYEWEQSGDLIDLNPYHFADMTEWIWVQKGPMYRAGDIVVLYDRASVTSKSLEISPGDGPLTLDSSWANKAAALRFQMQP